jgi:prophage maintenance system killer protein
VIEDSTEFLSPEAVQSIHRVVCPSVGPQCDEARLESAVRAVESYACYGDPDDLFDIAAAYAFYISEAQQVFLDGHKRTGLAACLAFLRLNGVPTEQYNTLELYDSMMQLALKQIDRTGLAERLRTPFSESAP